MQVNSTKCSSVSILRLVRINVHQSLCKHLHYFKINYITIVTIICTAAELEGDFQSRINNSYSKNYKITKSPSNVSIKKTVKIGATEIKDNY